RRHEAPILTAGADGGQTDLLQVVDTTRSIRCLADFLHCGEEQPDEHPDDGDHDEQLDQRESTPTPLADGGHVGTLSKERSSRKSAVALLHRSLCGTRFQLSNGMCDIFTTVPQIPPG